MLVARASIFLLFTFWYLVDFFRFYFLVFRYAKCPRSTLRLTRVTRCFFSPRVLILRFAVSTLPDADGFPRKTRRNCCRCGTEVRRIAVCARRRRSPRKMGKEAWSTTNGTLICRRFYGKFAFLMFCSLNQIFSALSSHLNTNQIIITSKFVIWQMTVNLK